MHQAFSLLLYHVHLVLPKRRWEWRPWLHFSSLADHERSSVMGYVIMAVKKVALGLWTMSLRSWMMPAHCFDQATDNIPFCHPPSPEGMVPRSLQYEFCNSTPHSLSNSHLLLIHHYSFIPPEDLPPTLVDPPHNLIKLKRSPRAFRYM